MVNGVTGSSQSLEQLRAQLDTLKKSRDAAKETKENTESNKTEATSNKAGAESTKSAADSAKDMAQTQKDIADAAVEVAKNAELSVSAQLATATACVTSTYQIWQDAIKAATKDNPNTAAIDAAEAAYNRALEQQTIANKALEEAKEAKEAAIEAQTKAADALEKAEKESAEAAAALEAATAALDNVVKELEEAVDALETAEAECAKGEEEVKAAEEAEKANRSKPLMTEEQALNEGYTIIHSYEDLLKIGNNLNGKYILMGDITIPEGVNWSPIGDANSPFKGTFDGNGCKISGLNIDVTEDEAENIGFFGVTDGTTLSNVTFVDAKVNGSSDYLTGTSNVGILSGCVKRTTVKNVHVTGDSSVTGYANAGGLIGAVDDRNSYGLSNVSTGNSLIVGCSTDVEINSKYAAGGLIGYVYGTESYQLEDHRGIATQSLNIRDCHTSGSATVDDESVGGLIGETGKTLVTLDKCSSDMDLTWTNVDGLGDLSFLLETGRIGGLVGNINGTYITLANCEFEGSLNGDTEFQSDVYGWYMNDAHVSIYDLPDGLPVDDILNISGIDGMTQLPDGNYQCTVSTLSGLDKMVAMLKENPDLADQIVWQINFDFDTMNGAYDYSDYAQYGIVQHLYEDEDGNVHNDVYIDNECDLESTYHGNNLGMNKAMGELQKCNGNCEPESPKYQTMVPGLWKNEDGEYGIIDDNGKFRAVTLNINADGQITDTTKRLTSSEVAYRERLVELGKKLQNNMRNILKDMFNWNKDEPVPILTKAEYKKLLKKAEKNGYDSLTDAEKLGMAVFEVDYDIMNVQTKYTKNMGCGMGGNASFLDKTTTHQMYDENGNALYTNLDGDQLIKDESGNYKYADGSGPYYGMSEVFEQRGYQNTDENGNLLFNDKDGNTVTQIKGEDGQISYKTTDTDGNQVDYEGDIDSLQRQLTPANYSEDYENFESDLEGILQDVNDGKYPKGMSAESSSGTENAAEEADSAEDADVADETDINNDGDIDEDGDVDEDDKDKEEV